MTFLKYEIKDSPLFANTLTMIITILLILFIKLDSILPITTISYLTTYALLNYSCFSASLSSNINWRPTYRMNKYLAVLIGLICITTVFLINISMCKLINSCCDCHFIDFIFNVYFSEDLSTESNIYIHFGQC